MPPRFWAPCYKCGRPGHIANNCPLVRCYRCQQLGHLARNCPGPHSSQRPQSSHVTGTNQYQWRGAGSSQSHGRPAQDVSTCSQAYTQTAQGTSQPERSTQTAQGISNMQPLTPVEAATNLWVESVKEWYPNLHSQTYFLPPMSASRVPYDVETVGGLPVLVPHVASDKPNQAPATVPNGPAPQPNPPQLASQVYQPVAPGDPLGPVYDSDVKEDRAMQQVRQRLEQLAERRQEVMFVLSQLKFRKYLDNQVDPITAAATRLLPRPSTLGHPKGDFDILMISRRYGLIVGEVKAIGIDPQHGTDQAITKKVLRAVKQLNTAHGLLERLVSDLGTVRITKMLMLPNVTSTQLEKAVDSNPQLGQDLRQCLGAPDTAAAVARCLCKDNSDDWWDRSVTDHGQNKNMTSQLYEQLVARFCGPATSIEVPTVTTPRRRVELRTLSEAIAHTGLRMAILTLHPEQVALLNKPRLEKVFLWGPPGTGKTVTLYLKARQWRQRKKDVHLLSSHRESRAAILLIQHQLLSDQDSASMATGQAPPRVHCHMYKFDSHGDVETAVQELTAAANGGELYVIADEAFRGFDKSGHGGDNTRSRFSQFITLLVAKVPHLHLWAAAVDRVQVPGCVSVQHMVTPLRSPPSIVREVAKSSFIDGKDILKYRLTDAPVPTDGHALRRLPHYSSDTRDGEGVTPLPGHAGRCPEDCGRCGEDICDLLQQLRVGEPGQDLQCRDVIILCDNPSHNLPIVSTLRARGVPVQVVTSSDDEAAIRDVALAVRDAVTVTDWKVMTGMERRVVVGVESGSGNAAVCSCGYSVGDDRLRQMSRSSALLVWVGNRL